jgi:hypothetical protein
MPEDPNPPKAKPEKEDQKVDLSQAALQKAQSNLNELTAEIAIGCEWGIFGSTTAAPNTAFEDVLSLVKAAQDAITQKDPGLASIQILRGKKLLVERQNESKCFGVRKWAFVNHWGWPQILITALSGVCVFAILLGYLGPYELIQNPMFLGFLGALMKSLFWVQFQINRGLLRPRWMAHYVVAPWVGALLGWSAKLVVEVTLKLATTGDGASYTVDWRLVGLVAVYSGFNWEWALAGLRKAANSVVQKSNGAGSQ